MFLPNLGFLGPPPSHRAAATLTGERSLPAVEISGQSLDERKKRTGRPSCWYLRSSEAQCGWRVRARSERETGAAAASHRLWAKAKASQTRSRKAAKSGATEKTDSGQFLFDRRAADDNERALRRYDHASVDSYLPQALPDAQPRTRRNHKTAICDVFHCWCRRSLSSRSSRACRPSRFRALTSRRRDARCQLPTESHSAQVLVPHDRHHDRSSS